MDDGCAAGTVDLSSFPPIRVAHCVPGYTSDMCRPHSASRDAVPRSATSGTHRGTPVRRSTWKLIGLLAVVLAALVFPAQVLAQVNVDDPCAASATEPRAAGSRIERRTFASDALGREACYLIYLPRGYDDETERYPVVYQLHGVAGDATEWLSIGTPDAADQLIEDGTIRPLIVVFPYGDASYYVDANRGGPRWEEHVVREVVSDVDASYRTFARRESRAVAGLSMGGDGALQLAMRYPEVYGISAAHSPSTRLLFEHASAEAYRDEAFFRAHNPYWLAQSAPGLDRVTFWIDIGVEDHWRWNTRAIHATLSARGIPHEFTQLPGRHEGEYWVDNVGLYLRYYDRVLAR